MEKGFCCPVCGGALTKTDGGLGCGNGHRFDRARQGYYNLLMSNKSSAKRHGDDGLMISARTAFLERGYYAPVRDALCRIALPLLSDSSAVLDAGCGEGYYAQLLARQAAENGKQLTVLGADISKDAVKAAARRACYSQLAVASVSRLPIVEGGCDMVLNIFSPPEITEYARILSPGGVLIRALPLEDHLWSLKAAVYERPYRNPAPEMSLSGFNLIGVEDVQQVIHLTSTEDILALFAMTPYWYKTSPADRAKLETLATFDVELAIRLAAYKKI